MDLCYHGNALLGNRRKNRSSTARVRLEQITAAINGRNKLIENMRYNVKMQRISMSANFVKSL